MTYTGDYQEFNYFVGRLERKKGVIFLEAIANRNKINKEIWKIDSYCGGGSEEAKLHLLAEKLGIDDICHFVGEISHEEVGNVPSSFEHTCSTKSTRTIWIECN